MSEQQEEQTGVNLVQEVSKSGHGQPPLPYVLREEDRPTSDQPLASDVPVIDISRLFKNQSGSHDDEAEKLRSALQSWGLFQAIGHDISASFLDEVRDVAKKFFQLPMEIKQKYSNIKEELSNKKGDWWRYEQDGLYYLQYGDQFKVDACSDM